MDRDMAAGLLQSFHMLNAMSGDAWDALKEIYALAKQHPESDVCCQIVAIAIQIPDIEDDDANATEA